MLPQQMSNSELLELWQLMEEQGLLPCVLINGITPAVRANTTLACVRHSIQALAATWGHLAAEPSEHRLCQASGNFGVPGAAHIQLPLLV